MDSAAAELEIKALSANEHKRAQLAHLLLSHLLGECSTSVDADGSRKDGQAAYIGLRGQ